MGKDGPPICNSRNGGIGYEHGRYRCLQWEKHGFVSPILWRGGGKAFWGTSTPVNYPKIWTVKQEAFRSIPGGIMHLWLNSMMQKCSSEEWIPSSQRTTGIILSAESRRTRTIPVRVPGIGLTTGVNCVNILLRIQFVTNWKPWTDYMVCIPRLRFSMKINLISLLNPAPSRRQGPFRPWGRHLEAGGLRCVLLYTNMARLSATVHLLLCQSSYIPAVAAILCISSPSQDLCDAFPQVCVTRPFEPLVSNFHPFFFSHLRPPFRAFLVTIKFYQFTFSSPFSHIFCVF